MCYSATYEYFGLIGVNEELGYQYIAVTEPAQAWPDAVADCKTMGYKLTTSHQGRTTHLVMAMAQFSGTGLK